VEIPVRAPDRERLIDAHPSLRTTWSIDHIMLPSQPSCEVGSSVPARHASPARRAAKLGPSAARIQASQGAAGTFETGMMLATSLESSRIQWRGTLRAEGRNMGGRTDQVKGRTKEAVGVLVGDKRLEREGKAQRATGQIKEHAEDLADAVEDEASDLAEGVKKATQKLVEKVKSATRG